MYLLAIDTASNSGGVAISRNSEVIGLFMLKAPLRYSEALMGMLEAVLLQSEVKLDQVTGLAVAVGPGSFTGVRIGLAVAKAIGQSRRVPAVGISTLEALAWRFRAHRAPVSVLIDARRQQVYAAHFKVVEDEVVVVTEQSVCAPSEWLQLHGSSEAVFAGDGSEHYRRSIEALVPGARIVGSDNRILVELCQLGYRRHCSGRAAPVSELAANYIRPSDAQLNQNLSS